MVGKHKATKHGWDFPCRFSRPISWVAEYLLFLLCPLYLDHARFMNGTFPHPKQLMKDHQHWDPKFQNNIPNIRFWMGETYIDSNNPGCQGSNTTCTLKVHVEHSDGKKGPAFQMGMILILGNRIKSKDQTMKHVENTLQPRRFSSFSWYLFSGRSTSAARSAPAGNPNHMTGSGAWPPFLMMLSQCMDRKSPNLWKKRWTTVAPWQAEANLVSLPSASSSARVLWLRVFSSECCKEWTMWQ